MPNEQAYWPTRASESWRYAAAHIEDWRATAGLPAQWHAALPEFRAGDHVHTEHTNIMDIQDHEYVSAQFLSHLEESAAEHLFPHGQPFGQAEQLVVTIPNRHTEPFSLTINIPAPTTDSKERRYVNIVITASVEGGGADNGAEKPLLEVIMNNPAGDMINLFVAVESPMELRMVRGWNASHDSLWNDVVAIGENAHFTSYAGYGGGDAHATSKALIRHAGIALLHAKGATAVHHARAHANHPACYIESAYHMHHLAANSYSDHSFFGYAQATQTLAGLPRVYVAEGCGGVEANQLTQFLVNKPETDSSKQPTTLAKPQLDIYHHDVVCAHGVAMGMLDHEQLRYLQHRGLSSERAKKLLITAMLHDKLPENLRESSTYRWWQDLVLHN